MQSPTSRRPQQTREALPALSSGDQGSSTTDTGLEARPLDWAGYVPQGNAPVEQIHTRRRQPQFGTDPRKDRVEEYVPQSNAPIEQVSLRRRRQT